MSFCPPGSGILGTEFTVVENRMAGCTPTGVGTGSMHKIHSGRMYCDQHLLLKGSSLVLCYHVSSNMKTTSKSSHLLPCGYLDHVMS